MAVNQHQRWLICYDIADPKRLVRVHRFLRDQGLPVQYSVFTVYLSTKRLGGVLDGLRARIEPRKDDVRVYPLPAALECETLGVQFFPDGVLLLAADANLAVSGGATQHSAGLAAR